MAFETILGETVGSLLEELFEGNAFDGTEVAGTQLAEATIDKVLALEFPENDYDAVVAYTVELQSILPEGSAERIRVDQIYTYLNGDVSAPGTREIKAQNAHHALQKLVNGLQTRAA